MHNIYQISYVNSRCSKERALQRKGREREQNKGEFVPAAHKDSEAVVLQDTN